MDYRRSYNTGKFGIPHFAEVFPENYKQDWGKLPREFPDSFVREFGEWSAENGVKANIVLSLTLLAPVL